MFIFKAGPRKVFRLKPVRCAKKVADPCFKPLSDYPDLVSEIPSYYSLVQILYLLILVVKMPVH